MVKKRLDEVVRRRVQAGRLLLDGKTPAQTAKVLGVARQSLCLPIFGPASTRAPGWLPTP